MGRNIVAVIVGVVVGMVPNYAIILLNSYVLFPMPEGVTFDKTEEFNAYVATLPAIAFVVVIVAHLAQAFVGGWVAARLGKSHPVQLAMIIGVLSLIGGIMAFIQIDGPMWVAVEFPLYLLLAGAAGKMEANRRARQSS